MSCHSTRGPISPQKGPSTPQSHPTGSTLPLMEGGLLVTISEAGRKRGKRKVPSTSNSWPQLELSTQWWGYDCNFLRRSSPSYKIVLPQLDYKLVRLRHLVRSSCDVSVSVLAQHMSVTLAGHSPQRTTLNGWFSAPQPYRI